MPDRIEQAPWLEYLLEVMYQCQWQLLQYLYQLGWVDVVDGQPAWPWGWRLSGDNLLIDVGQARAVLLGAGVIACLLLVALLAWRWRRLRWPVVVGALLALWLTPWPAARVLWVPANATSFHTPAVPWSVQAIAAGARHYAQYCVQCHGTAGDGQGPLAKQQAVWPPNFSGPLLWRRADGDLFAHVRYGMHNRQGQTTMPGFADTLSVNETWEVLHYLRAQAAAQILQATGEWAQPIPMPEMQLRCRAANKTTVHAWHGQRLLLVTGAVNEWVPDPRLVSIWLPSQGDADVQLPSQVDCVVLSLEPAWQTMSILTGADVEQQPVQMLSDRQGWLRAMNSKATRSWSEGDLICSAPLDVRRPSGLASEDGLGRLLRLMDMTPVRFVKGGRVH